MTMRIFSFSAKAMASRIARSRVAVTATGSLPSSTGSMASYFKSLRERGLSGDELAAIGAITSVAGGKRHDSSDTVDAHYGEMFTGGIDRRQCAKLRHE